MQQYAGIYLLQNHSTCFGCLSHLSSGVHKTVTAASGTGHSIWVTTFLQCGLIRPHCRKVFNCRCFVFEMNHETKILTGEQNSSNAGFTKYMY
jgi:hypothetical protein